MVSKAAYFQGGGGVNEPTPGETKYEIEPAITVQPRFVEPLYRNYDLYDTEGVDGPAKHGPGSGWQHMNQYKSIKEFLEHRRQRLKGKYVAEDSYIDATPSNHQQRINKMKVRAILLGRIMKVATKKTDENDGPNYDLGDGLYQNMDKYDSVKEFRQSSHKSPGAFSADDYMIPPGEHNTKIYDWKNSPYQGKPKAVKRDSNHLDFPIDDQVTPIEGDPGPYNNSGQLGFSEQYITNPDVDGKSEDALNFGFDLDDEAPVGRHYLEENDPISGVDLDELEQKYLTPAESDIYGLPDGVDSEDKDADKTIETENPEFGIPDAGRNMYQDKWNI